MFFIRCLWLPRYLPPKVDIVVSTLPDMHGILPKLHQLLGNQDCFLPVAPLPERTGNEIMQSWMSSIGRSVTEEQENIVKRGELGPFNPFKTHVLGQGSV